MNINLFGIIFLLLLFLFVWQVILAIVLSIKIRVVKHSPTQENAWSFYKTLCKFGVAIKNHPKTWGKYRDAFYIINQSPDVPSELKQKIKERLMKKGLYINNMRIIDNYKGGQR